MIASVAWAADVERYLLVLPASTNGADGVNDSTYASMSGVSKAIDLNASGIYRVLSQVSWTKSSDVDSMHVIMRTSANGTDWFVIDSTAKTASGSVRKNFTQADSLLRYVQIYVKLAVDDQGAGIRPQAVSAYANYLAYDNRNVGYYGRTYQGVINEP